MLAAIAAIGVLPRSSVRSIRRAAIGLALALSAAAIAPLADPLACGRGLTSADALLALLAGLAGAEAVIVVGGSATPSIDRLAAAAVIACVIATLAGFTVSLLRRNDPVTQGGAFVQGVLHGGERRAAPG